MKTRSISSLKSPLHKRYICNSEETLQTALSTIHNSYDSLLIFDDNNKFAGMLTVYHTLFKNKNVPTTKVKTVAFHPMKVTSKSDIYDVAEYMANEQIYLLPFFEEDAVTGVILAKNILKLIHEDTKIQQSLAVTIAYSKAVTVATDSSLNDVYPLLRESEAPGIVVVDEKGKAVDFIHRNELIFTFIAPTDKQRFGKNGFRPTDWAFDEEKVKRLDDSTKQYMRGYTAYSDSSDSSEHIISKLLRSKHEAIVILDKDKVPAKVLSIQNILSAFASLKPTSGVNIILKKPSASVSDTEFRQTYNSLQTFSEKLDKRLPLEKILVSTEESKYQDKKTAMYDSTIIIVPWGEGQYVAQAKSKSYAQSLSGAMKQIEKQQRRDHTNKYSYTAEESLDNQAL